MAATKECRHCKTEMPGEETTCPQCNRPQDSKKGTIITIVGVLVVIIVFPILLDLMTPPIPPERRLASSQTKDPIIDLERMSGLLMEGLTLSRQVGIKLVIDSRSVTAKIMYKEDPRGYEDVEGDTMKVAEKILAVLVEEGHDPREEWVTIEAWAQKPVKYSGNAPRYLIYGKTVYDFQKDALEWQPQ